MTNDEVPHKTFFLVPMLQRGNQVGKTRSFHEKALFLFIHVVVVHDDAISGRSG